MSAEEPWMSRRRFRRDPVEVSQRLGRYRRGGGAPASDLARLRTAWPDVVGADIGRQSIVVRRSQAGVLTVACSSAPWAHELDMRRDRILMALSQAVPDVTLSGLRFVIGDHVMPDEPTAPTRQPPVVTERDRTIAEAETPPLADTALRDLIVRARAAQLAQERQQKDLQKAQKPGRRSRRG